MSSQQNGANRTPAGGRAGGRSRRVAALVVVVAAALVAAGIALLVVGGGTAATQAQPPTPAVASPPVKTDSDGDKVFDDLEVRLDNTAATAAVPVIVTLTDGVNVAKTAALQATAGSFTVDKQIKLIDAFSTKLRKGQVEALTHVPWVAHVEEDSTVQALNATPQQGFGVTQARLEAPSIDGDADGNPGSYSNKDMVAAVIDTGIDATHLDLNGGKVLAFKDYVNGRTTPYDDNGHGTHVAATIAGDGEASANRAEAGVAPGGALVGVKVLNASGSGSMSDVAAAIDWIVANKDVYGIKSANLSLGTTGCADGTDAASLAVNRAVAAGIVMAVAAGNSGPGACTVASPGAAAGAITVGAMADLANGGFALASFSSRGPTADGRVKPDIASPGVNVISARANSTNGYATMSGTSMATPFVAGVALLIRDANPDLTALQVKDLMMSTAVDWGRGGNNRTAGTTGADDDYGAGRLDAYAALKAAGAPLTATANAPSHVFYEDSFTTGSTLRDYKLTITSTSYPITATMITPSITTAAGSYPTFQLQLLNPSGAQLAAAPMNQRQQVVTYKPAVIGTYTVRVIDSSGAGDYFLDVSAGLQPTTPAPPDTTPPTITAVAPADAAVDVVATTNVSVTFSEAMSSAATQSAFSLATAGGTSVAGAFSWNGNTLVFDPTSDLTAGVRYTATVATGAKDAAGNALAAVKTWSFTIAAAPTGSSATPSSAVVYFGSLSGGDASKLGADDDAFYEVDAASAAADWYGRVTGVPNGLTSLAVTYSGKASATCDQLIGLYNWTIGEWIRIDARTASTAEDAATVSPSGTLADFVGGESGDGDVAVRVRCTRDDSTGFSASGDLLKVSFGR